MSEVLIIKFDIDPEVSYYMDSEEVSLKVALKGLEKSFTEAVTTDLEIADKEDLVDYGTKGRDYIVIKNANQLEQYGYDLEDVKGYLGVDTQELKQLGLAFQDHESDNDDD